LFAGLLSSPGSLAIITAFLRASSLLKQLGCRSPARLILEIDMRQLFAGAVRHDKAGVQFLDSPRWQEAAYVSLLRITAENSRAHDAKPNTAHAIDNSTVVNRVRR